MAKKERVAINRGERLSEIDLELDAAMERLDQTNERIDDVLTSFDLLEASEGAEDASDDEGDSDSDGDLEADADADEDDEDADSSE